MAHQRQVIRDAVVARLLSHTAAGTRVFVEDRRSVRTGELPAIVVFSTKEISDHEGTAARELKRDMDLVIEAYAAETAGTKAADARDNLALEIETVMHADPYLGGVAGDSFLSETELQVDEVGDRLIAAAALTYAITYHTLAPEAPTDLDDFERVQATHKIKGGVGDTVPAVDQFTVEAP